jgi:hypothetical protein
VQVPKRRIVDMEGNLHLDNIIHPACAFIGEGYIGTVAVELEFGDPAIAA